MIKLWGINQCQTVRNARAWLDNHDIEYQFCDFKKNLLSSELLAAWLAQMGQEKLVNRRGTSWRLLDDIQRNQLNNNEKVIDLLLDKTSLIKRPVLTSHDDDKKILLVGFHAELYSHQFQIE